MSASPQEVEALGRIAAALLAKPDTGDLFTSDALRFLGKRAAAILLAAIAHLEERK